MVSKKTDFETFEKQFTELVGEFQLMSISETRLREALRREATRAEAAEAARDASARSAVDARANAAAATSGATQIANTLTHVQDELTNTKMQLELTERQRTVFEEKCSEMSETITVLKREIQQLKHLQTSYSALQRDYIDLQERIKSVTEIAKSEAQRLESELRRVERSASAGTELRERARLAAAAHARDRRLVAAELLDTTTELQHANVEITRLKALTAEMQYQLSEAQVHKKDNNNMFDNEVLKETKASLEAERNITAKLERALAASIADNLALAAQIHAEDNKEKLNDDKFVSEETIPTNICPIDSFLAES